MFPEAILHRLEVLNAVHALRVFLREYEAAECRSELLATRPIRHTAQARTIPVDLAGLLVECSLLTRFLF